MTSNLPRAGSPGGAAVLTRDMNDRFADQDVIRRLLAESKTWAFVGLGDNPRRTAYDQARLLQMRGKRIIPVHPAAKTVLDEQGYASMAEVPVTVDVVGVYRRSEFAGQAVDEAIAAGAGAVWLPPGVIDEAAAQRALDAGLDVVMDRCPGVEWALRRDA
jgi:predicted CoA-binding protein